MLKVFYAFRKTKQQKEELKLSRKTKGGNYLFKFNVFVPVLHFTILLFIDFLMNERVIFCMLQGERVVWKLMKRKKLIKRKCSCICLVIQCNSTAQYKTTVPQSLIQINYIFEVARMQIFQIIESSAFHKMRLFSLLYCNFQD